jgi:hypothetical protein
MEGGAQFMKHLKRGGGARYKSMRTSALETGFQENLENEH